MPKNPPPPPQGAVAGAPPMGGNFSLTREQLAAVEQLTREIQKFETDRNSINEKIGERRAQIKAFGIDMDAWRAAKRRKEMDPEDRANFDRSQQMVNAALGVPVQADLFADAADDGVLPTSLN